MEQSRIGSVEYIESILSKRGHGINLERKLPAVLVYLYANAFQSIYGLEVSGPSLGPFSRKTAANRRELLNLLDKGHGSDKRVTPCIYIEYGDEQGRPMRRVRLLRENIVAALRMFENQITFSWQDILRAAECTEDDLRQLNDRRERIKNVVARAVQETEQKPHAPTPPIISAEDAEMLKKISAAQSELASVVIEAGAGAYEKNLQNTLDALWKASHAMGTPGMLQDSMFKQFSALEKYIRPLWGRGCFGDETLFDGGRRKTFLRIHLVKTNVPKFESRRPNEIKSAATADSRIQPSRVPDGFALINKSELQRLKDHAAKKETRSGRPVTFVFVDVGNLTGERIEADKNNGNPGRRVLNVDNLNWRALRQLIHALPCARERVTELFAYVWSGISSNLLISNARSEGFTLVFHPKTDTDVAMSGDIGYFARDAMAKHSIVHLLLVTGDGDYNRTLCHVKKGAQETNTQLTISVIARKCGLNKSLYAIADSVLPIDPRDLMIFQRYHGDRMNQPGTRFKKVTHAL